MGKVSRKLSYNGTRKLTKQCHVKDTGCLKCTTTEHAPALGLITLFSSGKRSRTLMNWNLNFFETLASVPDWTSPSLALGKPIKLAFPLSFPRGLRESLGLAWLPWKPIIFKYQNYGGHCTETTTLGLSGKRETRLRKCHHYTGLFSWWLINVEGPRPVWVVLPLDRWYWLNKKEDWASHGEQRSTLALSLLQFLPPRSSFSSFSDIHQWFTEAWLLPKLLSVMVMTIEAEKSLGQWHYWEVVKTMREEKLYHCGHAQEGCFLSLKLSLNPVPTTMREADPSTTCPLLWCPASSQFKSHGLRPLKLQSEIFPLCRCFLWSHQPNLTHQWKIQVTWNWFLPL